MTEIRRTPLYEEHKKLNARFTEFGGWDMPVFYTSIIDEHNAVRSRAGLFDASHMGEFVISGKDAAGFLDRVTVSDISSLEPGRAKYTMMLNERGGIIDDLIIYRRENDFFVVANAGNAAKDWKWLSGHTLGDVKMEDISDRVCLIALQGPDSERILQPLLENDLSELKYFRYANPGFKESWPAFSMLARTGYTGEDGFEIFISPESAPALWEKLVAAGAKPCGLGARDTLRLEACMPLHGHEINDDITPIEAGLGWTVFWDKDFIGRAVIEREKENGPKMTLVAFTLDSGIPRQNFDIIFSGQKVGRVASGTFSPTFKKGIGTGFTNVPLEPGARVEIMVHNQPKPAGIVKKPFYKRKK